MTSSTVTKNILSSFSSNVSLTQSSDVANRLINDVTDFENKNNTITHDCSDDCADGFLSKNDDGSKVDDRLCEKKDSIKIKERLLREISCLERQLARLKKQTFNHQKPVLKTYEEMIQVRHDLLVQID